MKSVTLLLLALNLFLFASAQRELNNPLVNSGQLLEKGISLHDEGKYKEAIATYLKIPASDTNYSRVLHELILSYYNDSNFVEAEKTAKFAIDMFPEKTTEWLAMLADVYDDTQRTGEAITAYDQILAQKPYDYLVYFNKGVSLYKAQKLDEAEKNFQQCLIINPYYPSAHYFLGKISLLKGRIVEAMISLSTNLLVSPGNRYQKTSISLLSAISDMNAEVSTLMQKYKSGKENDFESLQDIISSKISLDKKYKLEADLEDHIVRQLQVLFEKLEYNAGDKGFWMQFYAPLFKSIWDKKQFEPFIFYIFSKLDIKKVTDYVSKEKKDIEKMSNLVVEYFNDVRESQQLQYDKRKTSNPRFFINDYKVTGKGNYGVSSKGETLLTGPWEFYHSTGKLKSKGSFNSEGLREGEWRFYYENGQLHEVTNYHDNKAQGKSESWHDNGITYQQSNYKDDELDGEQKTFFYNGMPRRILNFKMGKKDGPAKYFNSDGFLTSTAVFKDDLQEGEEITYHENGKIESKSTYTKDEPEGSYTEYYESGKTKLTGQFENGKKSGTWKALYENGQTEFIENFSKGELDGDYVSYYENGKIESKSVYKKGEVDGKKEDYDDDGILFCVTIVEKGRLRDISFYDKKGQVISNTSSRKGNANVSFYAPDGSKQQDGYFNRDGAQDGKATYYFKNGKTSVEAIYKEGLMEGKKTSYYSTGTISQEGFYKANEPDGYFVNYYNNGTVSNEGWYVEGKRQGTFIYYDQFGKLTSKVYYLNGDVHGVSEYFNADGRPDYTEYYDNSWFNKLVQFDTTGKVLASSTLDKGNGPVVFKHYNGKPYIDFNYKNYRINGMYKITNGDGSVRSISYYKNGLQDSTYKAWYPNGKLQTEGSYENGDKTGTWKYYWRNGQISETETYVKGKLEGKDIQYNEDGSVDKEMNFKKGNLEGEYKFFAENKQLAAVLYYKDDELLGYSYEDKNGTLVPMIAVPKGTGMVTCYFKNGNKSLQMQFNESVVDGDRILYYTNGKEHINGKRIAGYEHGIKKIYYPSGKLMKEENYYYGNQHGNSKYYNENGGLIHDLNYYDGDLHGSCKYYEGGKLTENLIYYYGMLEAKK